VLAAGLVLLWLALGKHTLDPWWLAAPVAVSVALAVAHDAVIRARDRCQRAVDYYIRALERLDDRWMGTGETGARFHDDHHPYARDLDIFGDSSLFQLLSTARTRMGEQTLAGWLRAPAAPDEVRARQAAVEELRHKLDLREQLAVIAEEARAGVHPEALAAWAEEPAQLASRPMRFLAAALTLLMLASWVVWAVWGERTFFLLMFLAVAGYIVKVRRQVAHVVRGVEEASKDLAILAKVLALVERENFQSPLLARLRAELETEGHRPSRRIARLRRLVELIESYDNVVVRVFGTLLLYVQHLAFAAEDWRGHSGKAVRRWLRAVGEFEALSSLAGFAYEHPDDAFPEITEEGPLFEAAGLAHPFLPGIRAVRNDVALNGAPRVLVVSGSNMSGKSTLLRTVGINAVLAQAGAPVRARRLRLSPLQPAASIHIVDSLQGGSSRFYAEITRLRLIVDLTAGPLPVLFLLDEFLNGTNSHDRRIGAEAIVRGLVERGSIGLLTTHDLALAHIAESLGERGANVHFEDRLEEGRLLFDYRMRPGVVRRSNALELMRSVGLEV